MASNFDAFPSDATSNSSHLPSDVLIAIFSAVSSHERRITLPLVCKVWRQALVTRCRELWREVEICDNAAQHSRVNALQPQDLRTKAIRKWLWDRCSTLADLRVYLASAQANSTAAHPLAPWVQSFGQALPVLAAAPALSNLSLHGPGVNAVVASTALEGGPAAPNAARELVSAAFCLPSLVTLHIYDVPWAAPLRLGPTGPALTNLRELVLHRSFYCDEQGSGGDNDTGASKFLGGDSVADAWETLGRELAARCPNLERLDLAYTHAMTFCDPARGAVIAPWPPLPRLRELSLAHDLAVQPPPPPPAPHGPAAPTALTLPNAGVGGASGPTEELHCSALLGMAGSPDGGREATGGGGGGGVPAASGTSSAADFHAEDGDDDVIEIADDGSVDDDDGGVVTELDDAELFGPPLLSVDAAHAAVELLSWLPSCASLTSLDLRRCGLEAVPLAVTHLPQLVRLDMEGNPLCSMRLPGPLPRLAWLRFSLDPCYDMLAATLAAHAGEAAAAEEAWAVELPAPQLEELEVDCSSERALGLLREAASSLAHLRRMVLVNNDSYV